MSPHLHSQIEVLKARVAEHYKLVSPDMTEAAMLADLNFLLLAWDPEQLGAALEALFDSEIDLRDRQRAAELLLTELEGQHDRD